MPPIVSRIAAFVLWLEPLILLAITVAFWFPTPGRADWLWMLWLLVPVLLARYLLRGRLVARTPMDVWILVFLVLSVVNIYIAPYTRGLLMLARPVLGIALYYAMVERARVEGHLRGPVQVMVLLALLLGIQALGATQWSDDGKSSVLVPILDSLPVIRGTPGAGLGYNPNEIAGAMVWLVPVVAGVAIYRWQTKGTRWDSTLAVVMLIAALILGQSRSSLAGMFVGLAIVITAVLRRYWRVVAWAGLLALLALEFAIITGVLSYVSARTAETTEDAGAAMVTQQVETGSSFMERLPIWNSALDIIRDYPATGVGLSMFRDSRVRQAYPWVGHEQRGLPHAHNELLQISADMGVPGMVLLLVFYLRVGWLAVTGDRSNRAAFVVRVAAAAGLFAHAIFGLADAITFWDRFSFIFWMTFGLFGATFVVEREPEASP